MSFFLIFIGVLFAGVTVALVGRSLVLSRLRTNVQMRQIDAYGFATVATGADVPGVLGQTGRRHVLAERVGQFALRNIPRLTPLPRVQLTAAGYRSLTAEEFHGYRVLLTFGLPTLVLFDAVAKGGLSPQLLLLIALCGLLGWRLPALFVRQRAQARLAHVDRQLPELMDLLTATIEAGMGFAGSLQLVADRMRGPLGEELKLTAQEQTMGLSTEQALDKMIERCDTPAMRSFSRAIHQAESLGTSIGSILRNLAGETRKRRRQAAQERIQKAPVKLLFPLVFLIFPSLLIVLLYPAVHQIFASLGAA